MQPITRKIFMTQSINDNRNAQFLAWCVKHKIMPHRVLSGNQKQLMNAEGWKLGKLPNGERYFESSSKNGELLYHKSRVFNDDIIEYLHFIMDHADEA